MAAGSQEETTTEGCMPTMTASHTATVAATVSAPCCLGLGARGVARGLVAYGFGVYGGTSAIIISTLMMNLLTLMGMKVVMLVLISGVYL